MFMEDLGNTAIQQIDERLAVIPHFQKLTQFPEGLKTLKLYTADHYRTLMKLM
ncbi:17409_t:CDS:1, partial [Funneliformis geosporum]